MSPYQNGDDAFELLLHQVTDDLVVEILDWLPLQTHKASWETEPRRGYSVTLNKRVFDDWLFLTVQT